MLYCRNELFARSCDAFERLESTPRSMSYYNTPTELHPGTGDGRGHVDIKYVRGKILVTRFSRAHGLGVHSRLTYATHFFSAAFFRAKRSLTWFCTGLYVSSSQSRQAHSLRVRPVSLLLDVEYQHTSSFTMNPE
jgi:hypothetical protein